MFFARIVCIALMSGSIYGMYDASAYTSRIDLRDDFIFHMRSQAEQHCIAIRQSLSADTETLKYTLVQMRNWMHETMQFIMSPSNSQHKHQSFQVFIAYFRSNAPLMDSCKTWAHAFPHLNLVLNYVGYVLAACASYVHDVSTPDNRAIARELLGLSRFYLSASVIQFDFLSPKICDLSHRLIAQNNALIARYDQQFAQEEKQSKHAETVSVRSQKELSTVVRNLDSMLHKDFEPVVEHDAQWQQVESSKKIASVLPVVQPDVTHNNQFACIASYDDADVAHTRVQKIQKTYSNKQSIPTQKVTDFSARECQKELSRAHTLYAEGSLRNRQEAEKIWERIACLQSDDLSIKKQSVYACGQLVLCNTNDIERNNRYIDCIEKMGFSEGDYYRAIRAYNHNDCIAANELFTKYLECNNPILKRYRLHAWCYKTVIASDAQDELLTDALQCLKKAYQEAGSAVSFQEYEPLQNTFFLKKIGKLITDLGKTLETHDVSLKTIYADWAYFAARLCRDAKSSVIKDYLPQGLTDLELFMHAAYAGHCDAQEIVYTSPSLALFDRVQSLFSLIAQESLSPDVREKAYKVNAELAVQGYFGPLELECARIVLYEQGHEINAESLFKRLDKNFPPLVFSIGREAIPRMHFNENVLQIFEKYAQNHWSARVLRSASILVTLYNNRHTEYIDDAIKTALLEIQILEKEYKEHAQLTSTLGFANMVAGALWNYKTQKVGLSNNPTESVKASKSMDLALKFFDKATSSGDMRGAIFRAQSYILSKGIFKEDNTVKGVTLLKEIVHKDQYYACEASMQLCTYFINVGDRHNAQKYLDTLYKFPEVKYDQRIKEQLASLQIEINAIEKPVRTLNKKRDQKKQQNSHEDYVFLKSAVESLKEAQRYCDTDPCRAFNALENAEKQFLFSVEKIDDYEVRNLYTNVITSIKQSASKICTPDECESLHKECDAALARYEQFRLQLLYDCEKKVDATLQDTRIELEQIEKIKQEYSQIMFFTKTEEKTHAFTEFAKKYDLSTLIGLRNVDVHNCMAHQMIMCYLGEKSLDATLRLSEATEKKKALVVPPWRKT